MAVRYGVGSTDAFGCGARTVVYQPDGCSQCLPIKIGERQIFEIDFSGEVACNARRIGCSIDYDELVSVVSFTSLPETVFGSGTIGSSVQSFDERSGIVKMLIDATDANLQSDEKWSITLTVDLESGRRLKTCFQVRTIPCGSDCSALVCDDCNGPILASLVDCSSGILILSDETPSGTVCALVYATCDAYYTIDGSDPTDSASPRIPISAGTEKKLTGNDIANFRMSNASGDCNDCTFTRIYRGS